MSGQNIRSKIEFNPMTGGIISGDGHAHVSKSVKNLGPKTACGSTVMLKWAKMSLRVLLDSWNQPY